MNYNNTVNILLVDDKEDNLYSIKILLESDNYNFLLASSGEKALKLALKEDVSLILLDVNMPEMDGYEVARILKKNSKTKNIPIIFLTAIDYDIENMLKGFDAGALDYIIKPVNTEILKAKVKTYSDLFVAQKAIAKLNNELEEKVLERTKELEKRNIELEKMNLVLDNFLHVTAHDLRAPLSNITLLTQMLKSEKCTEKDNIIDNIDNSINQMQKTIGGIVQMIEVQERKDTPPAKINFEVVLDKIKDFYSKDLNEIKASINTDFKQTDDFYYIPDYIESIFRNLINNSIKYRSKQRFLEIDISARKEKEYTLIEIKDNGIGIDMNKYGKNLFKPFNRINKNFDGAGIGLHLIKNMAEMNDGKIEVMSKPDAGTLFSIYLKSY